MGNLSADKRERQLKGDPHMQTEARKQTKLHYGKKGSTAVNTALGASQVEALNKAAVLQVLQSTMSQTYNASTSCGNASDCKQ